LIVYIQKEIELKLIASGRSVHEVLAKALEDVVIPPPATPVTQVKALSPKRQAILACLPSAPPGLSINQIKETTKASRITIDATLNAAKDVCSEYHTGSIGAPFRTFWLPPVSPPTPQAPESKDPSPATDAPPAEVKPNE